MEHKSGRSSSVTKRRRGRPSFTRYDARDNYVLTAPGTYPSFSIPLENTIDVTNNKKKPSPRIGTRRNTTISPKYIYIYINPTNPPLCPYHPPRPCRFCYYHYIRVENLLFIIYVYDIVYHVRSSTRLLIRRSACVRSSRYPRRVSRWYAGGGRARARNNNNYGGAPTVE